MTQKINQAKLMEFMLTEEGLHFESNEDWNVIAEHVNVHHQFLIEQLGGYVTYSQALYSWYENIYEALKLGIEISNLNLKFNKMSSGELYIAVSDHWYNLKVNNPEINAVEAVKDYAALNKPEKRSIIRNIIENTAEMYSIPRNTFADVFITAVYGNLTVKPKTKRTFTGRKRAA